MYYLLTNEDYAEMQLERASMKLFGSGGWFKKTFGHRAEPTTAGTIARSIDDIFLKGQVYKWWDRLLGDFRMASRDGDSIFAGFDYLGSMGSWTTNTEAQNVLINLMHQVNIGEWDSSNIPAVVIDILDQEFGIEMPQELADLLGLDTQGNINNTTVAGANGFDVSGALNSLDDEEENKTWKWIKDNAPTLIVGAIGIVVAVILSLNPFNRKRKRRRYNG